MRKLFLPVVFLAIATTFSACSTTDPVITANPDRSNSTSGTLGSSPATNGVVPKSTDTLSTPASGPRDTTLRKN